MGRAYCVETTYNSVECGVGVGVEGHLACLMVSVISRSNWRSIGKAIYAETTTGLGHLVCFGSGDGRGEVGCYD